MPPLLFDTHAHLNFQEFNNDWRSIATTALQQGIYIINAGVNYPSSQRAIILAQEYPTGVWAAVGLHPENIFIGDTQNSKSCAPENIFEINFNIANYRQLALSSNKVIAIGEIGLDYSRLPRDTQKATTIKNQQQTIFRQQLVLAS